MAQDDVVSQQTRTTMRSNQTTKKIRQKEIENKLAEIKLRANNKNGIEELIDR